MRGVVFWGRTGDDDDEDEDDEDDDDDDDEGRGGGERWTRSREESPLKRSRKRVDFAHR